MSKFNVGEISEEEINAIIQEDELMVEAERNASSVNESEKKEEMSEEEAIKEAEENRFLVPFTKEYVWNGQKIDSLDLSGLENLTTADGEHAEHVLARLGHFPANKFRDTTYTKLIAMRVTGLPIEFFNQLAIRDMMVITAKVYNYFLLG